MLLGSGCLDLGDDDSVKSSSHPCISCSLFSVNHMSLSQTQPQPTTLFFFLLLFFIFYEFFFLKKNKNKLRGTKNSYATHD